MSIAVALPTGALARGYEALPVSVVNRDDDLSPYNPNGNNTPGGSRTPRSRRARRSQKVKTWTQDSSVPSRGSKNHCQGKCRACYAFRTPEGCPNGQMCNFCHYPHDDDDSDEAVYCSEKKSARRLSFSLREEVIMIGYDSQGPEELTQKDSKGKLCPYGMPNCQFQCGPCVPIKRRNTAPAILTFDQLALPFLAPDATPDLCKRVLASVDSKVVEEILRQNIPEQYED